MTHQYGPLSLPNVGEIHLWRWSLDVSQSCLELCRNMLNTEEQRRAQRFFREVHRHRFSVGRGQLRILLGRYLNSAPEAIEFTYNEQGKPMVDFGLRQGTCAFNLSHSDHQALFAIAGFSTVGVDIEACRDSRDLLPIARRFFSQMEQAELLALPRELHKAAFYQCWSSKEALLKAWGTGLTTPLDQFSVRVTPGESGLRSITLQPWASTPWFVQAVEVSEGFAAAVAVPGNAASVSVRTWSQEQ